MLLNNRGLIGAVIEEYANQQSKVVSEWISVEDSLPEYFENERSKSVLVYADKIISRTSYNHKQGFWNLPLGTEKVTHWQPLAKPVNY